MPQLVKGGKHTFGWSSVSEQGDIAIPPDAYAEYGFIEGETAIVMSGSRKSGGLVLSRLETFMNSSISSILKEQGKLTSHQIPEGETIKIGPRFFCWVKIRDGRFSLPPSTLEHYGIENGSALLTVRGSNIGLAFIVKGPIIEEAKKHRELETFL
jgi:bifunctional DNA-binding transcriptional regulator/antitoxin component of YhaV-PrlF toxin-antitoxin module